MTKVSNYLLTTDILLTSTAFTISGLSTEPILFHNLNKRLIERLAEIIPHLEVIDFTTIVSGVKAKVQETLALCPEAVVVTTNPLLCDWPNCSKVEKHCCVEVNRLVDKDGKTLGLGPRPWNTPIHIQIRKLANTLVGKPIILIEDGSWSGKTLVNILTFCKDHEIEVKAVICGILFEKGLQHIESSGFEGIVSFVTYQDNCEDWMPGHDFLPFFPSNGKVVGEDVNGHLIPIRLGDKMSYSIPYIRPYGDPEKWASIPEKDVIRFSEGCLSDTIEFFQELETRNGPVTLNTIAGFYPRASIPHLIGQDLRFHSPQDRVVRILEGDYDILRREING